MFLEFNGAYNCALSLFVIFGTPTLNVNEPFPIPPRLTLGTPVIFCRVNQRPSEDTLSTLL